MIIGVPREIKVDENRVGLVPAGVEALVAAGHRVVVESDCAAGIGLGNEQYVAAGAEVVASAMDVWAIADMVVKVKEPLPVEYSYLRDGQIVFTYFHFAAVPSLVDACRSSGAICIAYETVQTADGQLPLLAPMSEVAGRMAVQEGAKYLERAMGGRGILLGGVPGVSPANVAIIGGGMVGTEAAKVAAGMGANVTVLDVSLPRLRYLNDVMPRNVTTLYANSGTIRDSVMAADLLIGAVLIRGAKAPTLVPKSLVAAMKPGAVIVDVAVDQGGCVETIRPTTHRDPVYFVDGVLHYGVANMPGAVPYTSTFALTNATQPYISKLAAMGWKDAIKTDASLRNGLVFAQGECYSIEVADQFALELKSIV
jgi:alanine dehydrogenase